MEYPSRRDLQRRPFSGVTRANNFLEDRYPDELRQLNNPQRFEQYRPYEPMAPI